MDGPVGGTDDLWHCRSKPRGSSFASGAPFVRRALIASLCLLTAASVSALGAPAAAAPAPAEQSRHGADAVRALGDHLAAVAAEHGTTAATLRERFQSDSSLWVDADRRLFYVDPAPQQAAADVASAALTGTPSGSQALFLHSRPDAKRTVYLDFDGVGPSYGGAIGGAWSTRTYTGGDGNAEPYSLDSIATAAFSSAELTDIVSIWQRVAEDFAPFDIDVTTQEPAPERIDRTGSGDLEYGTRVAITSSATSCGCGGVAYVGVFDQYPGSRTHAYYQPAFVYNKGAKYAAEAATHEAGHNLGLSHDGTASVGYYEGHGAWAPIMGVGYYRPLSQWSKGEYAGANNPEDDYAVIAANGGTQVPDTAGTALTLGTTVHGLLGVGEAGDTYSVTVPGGTSVTIAADHAEVSPNVDLRLLLDGVPVTDAGPVVLNADVATGLGASVAVSPTTETTYAVTVSGAEFGADATAGYSNYGSIGTYSLLATSAPVTASAPPTPAFATVAQSGSTVQLQWADVSSETSYELQRFSGTAETPTSVVLLAANRTSHVDSPGAGTWSYRLRALNSAGASASSVATATFTFAATSKPRGRK